MKSNSYIAIIVAMLFSCLAPHVLLLSTDPIQIIIPPGSAPAIITLFLGTPTTTPLSTPYNISTSTYPSAYTHASPSVPSWWNTTLQSWRSNITQKCGNCLDCIMPHMRQHLEKGGQSLSHYLKKNRWPIAWRGTLGVYIYINYLLFRLITFLVNSERWIYWNHQYSLAQLMDIPQSTLIHELTAASRLRRQESDIGPIVALQKLMAEVDDEIYALEKYAAWAHRINVLDDLQHRCAILCEGWIPKILSFSWQPNILGTTLGFAVRKTLDAISMHNIIYLHAGLIKLSSEYIQRLTYIRRVVEQYLHESALSSRSFQELRKS